jgi:hypothetical protein
MLKAQQQEELSKLYSILKTKSTKTKGLAKYYVHQAGIEPAAKAP